MATKSVPFRLTVQEVPPQPDFFPGIDPASIEVPQGTVAAYNCSFSTVGEFAGPVSLAVSGLPDGATATFDINPIGVGQTAMLTIDTANVAVGSYDLSLDATA